jgi:hypothetical protein
MLSVLAKKTYRGRDPQEGSAPYLARRGLPRKSAIPMRLPRRGTRSEATPCFPLLCAAKILGSARVTETSRGLENRRIDVFRERLRSRPPNEAGMSPANRSRTRLPMPLDSLGAGGQNALWPGASAPSCGFGAGHPPILTLLPSGPLFDCHFSQALSQCVCYSVF